MHENSGYEKKSPQNSRSFLSLMSYFLSLNPRRILNEPVCVMATSATDGEQDKWWPSRTSDRPLKTPKFCKSTTQRADFTDHGPVAPVGRHASNPYVTTTHGIRKSLG